VAEVMALVEEAWRGQSDEDREPYIRLAEMEANQYKAEVALLERAQRPIEVWQPFRRCKMVLDKLASDGFASIFLEPVNTDDFSDYLEYVDTPMDIGTVRSRLENRKYSGPDQFARDVRKIWQNCKIYNLHGSAIWNLADFMSRRFERLYHCWVLAFHYRCLRWADPVARPWEGSCRVHDGSCRTSDERLIMCDLCDATYGIGCLDPPLDEPPSGIWHCPVCKDAPKTAHMFSAMSEIASRRRAELADVPQKRMMRKMYLVKWAGLGYADCTWETAEDVNDDAIIKEYQRLNGAIPDEPALTLSEVENAINEVKHVTCEERFGTRTALYLSNISGLRSQLYAQTRLFQFLKFGMDIPERLGNECGHLMRGEVIRRKFECLPVVVDCVMDMVSQVSNGIIRKAAMGPNLPPPLIGEYDVVIPITENGLMMNLVNKDGFASFTSYNKFKDGSKGPVELANLIGVGDKIVAVNGVSMVSKSWNELIGFLQKLRKLSDRKFAHMRFLQFSYSSAGASLTSAGKSGSFVSNYIKKKFRKERKSILYRRHNPTPSEIGPGSDSDDEAGDHTTSDGTSSESDNDIFDSVSLDELQQQRQEQEKMAKSIKEAKNVMTKVPISLSNSKAFFFEERKETSNLKESTKSMGLRLLDMDLDYTSDEGGSHDMAYFVDGADSIFARKDERPLHNGIDSTLELPYSSQGIDTCEDLLLPLKKNEFNGLNKFAKIAAAISITHSKPLVDDFVNYPGPSPAVLVAMEAENLKRVKSMESSNSKKSKVAQIDPRTNEVLFVWASVEKAAAALSIPAKDITQVLKGEYNENVGEDVGGYQWRYAGEKSEVTISNVKEGKKQAWSEFQEKLYDHTNQHIYKGGHKLRDYQIDGLNWLARSWYKKHCCILADEMGLGKTVQIVTYIEHLHRVEKLKQPFLIVVPLSTLGHWEREFGGWTDFSVCVYHDLKREWRDVMREYEWYYPDRPRTPEYLKFNVLVTTYDTLISDFDVVGTIPWGVCVVDEAHRLRNVKGKLLECMKQIALMGTVKYGFQSRILMTGTPLQNNIQELWTLLNYIEPSKFPSMDDFSISYGNMASQEQVESLQKKISPFMLRRVKEDVAKDIPAKEETLIDVELTSLQKQYYRAVFEHNMNFLAMGNRTTVPKLMNIQMELRKCCNHPFLLDGVEEKEMEKVHEEILATGDQHCTKEELQKKLMERCLVGTSGKMVLLDKLLPKLRQEGHKVLIFSQMVRMLDVISDFLEFRGFQHERLDGRVRGNERQKAIDRFESDPDNFVFLLSTRAGGVGINLTAADICIIFDSDWNPQNDVQAQARCHRIGQTKDVMVYRLITAKTFEQEMFDRASKKLGLERAVLGTFGQENEDEKLNAKDMELLLKKGAYALQEGNDVEAKEFCEDNIDSILANRTRTRVVEGAQTASWLKNKNVLKKSKFTGKNSAATADVDVDDPLFWQKVMPDFVTPLIMFNKLKKMTLQNDASSSQKKLPKEGEMSKSTMKQAKKFMADLTSMMDGIIIENEDGNLQEDEKQLVKNILLKLSLKDKLFTRDQRDRAKKMLNRLEGDRRRKCRANRNDKVGRHTNRYVAELGPIDKDENNEKPKEKKKRGRKAKSDVGQPLSPRCKRKQTESVGNDEENSLSDTERKAYLGSKRKHCLSRMEVKKRKSWVSDIGLASAEGHPWPVFSRSDILKVFETFINKLIELDQETGGFFSEPVPADIPDYDDIIKNPMDYGTMKEKLLQGGYRSSQSIQRDFQLVISNCTHFNDSKAPIVKTAQKHTIETTNLLKASAIENNLFIDEDGTVLEIVEVVTPGKIFKKRKRVAKEEYENQEEAKPKRGKKKKQVQKDELTEDSDCFSQTEDSEDSEEDTPPRKKRGRKNKIVQNNRVYTKVDSDSMSESLDLEDKSKVEAPAKKRSKKNKEIRDVKQDSGGMLESSDSDEHGKVKANLRKNREITNGFIENEPQISPRLRRKTVLKYTEESEIEESDAYSEESEVDEGEDDKISLSDESYIESIDENIDGSSFIIRNIDTSALKEMHAKLLKQTSFKQVRKWLFSLGAWCLPANSTQSQFEELMLTTLQKMSRHDKHDLFAEEVSEEDAPGYFEEIKNPIDFGTMRDRIKDGFYSPCSGGISTFFDDCVLIFDNCIEYNSADSDVGKEASRVFSYLPVAYAICFEAVFGSNFGFFQGKIES